RRSCWIPPRPGTGRAPRPSPLAPSPPRRTSSSRTPRTAASARSRRRCAWPASGSTGPSAAAAVRRSAGRRGERPARYCLASGWTPCEARPMDTAAPVLPHHEDTRPMGPMVAPERDTLERWLETYRESVLLKVAGLTAEQLCRRSVPPSTLSLMGVVRHLTEVEAY